MRVQDTHRTFAANALDNREPKRSIQEDLIKKGLTPCQANNCVRNQAKRLKLYNGLTNAQKNQKRIDAMKAREQAVKDQLKKEREKELNKSK